jgi:hypothetical protein
MRWLPSSFGVIALASGCATTTLTYPGPPRPASEVAVFENSETSLDMLDGQTFTHIRSQNGERYDVLPGRHSLGVSLMIVSSGPYDADVERSSNTAIFCVDARPGHIYVLGHEGRGASWRPVITDEATRTVVPFAPCS